MTEREQWLPIPGWEGAYEVSDHGRVRSVDRTLADGRRMKGRVRKQSTAGIGYKHVILSVNGRRATKLVHRAVLEAFVGPCPDGMEACHGVGGPGDNRRSNLRWGTHSENNFDRVRQGTHQSARRTSCRRNHEYTPENTRVNDKGWRACRECQRVRRRARMENR